MRLDELPRSDRVEDRRGVTASFAGVGINQGIMTPKAPVVAAIP